MPSKNENAFWNVLRRLKEEKLSETGCLFSVTSFSRDLVSESAPPRFQTNFATRRNERKKNGEIMRFGDFNFWPNYL